MNRPCLSVLFLLFLSPILAWSQDYAEEMIPPPLDLDIRGTSLLWAGSPYKQAVALTFDDGPIPGKTDAVLAILREQGIKATFFLVGERIRSNPGLALQVALEGHDIGNHSESHRNLAKLGSAETIREISRCQDAISGAIGIKATLFRAPYGAANMTTLAALSHLSLSAVFWSIDTRDWKAQSEAEVQNAALKDIQNGDVILFHEHSRHTVGALPGIIRAISERGFGFETVSALFDRPQAGPPLLASATPPIEPLVTTVAAPPQVVVARAEVQTEPEPPVSLGGSEAPAAGRREETVAAAPASDTSGQEPAPERTSDTSKPEAVEVDPPPVAAEPEAPLARAESPIEQPESEPVPSEPVETAAAGIQAPSVVQEVAPTVIPEQEAADPMAVTVPLHATDPSEATQTLAKAEPVKDPNLAAISFPVPANPTGRIEAEAPSQAPPKPTPDTPRDIAKPIPPVAKLTPPTPTPVEPAVEAGRVRRLQPVARFKQRLVTPAPSEPAPGRVAQPRRLLPHASTPAPLPVEVEDSAPAWGYAAPLNGWERP